MSVKFVIFSIFFTTLLCHYITRFLLGKPRSYIHMFSSKVPSFIRLSYDWSLCPCFLFRRVYSMHFHLLLHLSGSQTDCGCSSPSNVIVSKCARASRVTLIVSARPRAHSSSSSLTNISVHRMHADCSKASDWRGKRQISSTSQLCILLLFSTLRQRKNRVGQVPTSMCYSSKQTLSISVCT